MRQLIARVWLVAVLLQGLPITTSATVADEGDEQNGPGYYLDLIPTEVVATMEVRDRWFTSTAAFAEAQAYLVEDIVRWLPGQTVRVAFLGGTPALHGEIAEATRQITDAANIKLDFGFDAATGRYRSWSTKDSDYSAEIRVSFDQAGYFSLVGADSISNVIGPPNGPVGGRPGQRSLNLGGFHLQRPVGWKGTVRHEFLHALAFQHEHQSPSGGCDNEFRWQDDQNYQPKWNADHVYVKDDHGNRPGIYTYLAGAPNHWDKAMVDHNLRQLSSQGMTVGAFDRASIMLYQFPAIFYKTFPDSPCAPTSNGQELSAGDREGLKHLYPTGTQEAAELSGRRSEALRSLMKTEGLSKSIREGLVLQVESQKLKGKV